MQEGAYEARAQFRIGSSAAEQQTDDLTRVGAGRTLLEERVDEVLAGRRFGENSSRTILPTLVPIQNPSPDILIMKVDWGDLGLRLSHSESRGTVGSARQGRRSIVRSFTRGSGP